MTFLALTFLMLEAHEIVHTSIGRIICGCWGQRDFNAWNLCDSCEKNPFGIIATLVGPIFTYIMIWYGNGFLDINKTVNQKAFGFSLIFANLPFGRLLTALLGGGDEVVVVNTIVNNRNLSRLIVIILIILIIAYPLFNAYRLIENKYKTGWFLVLLLVPVLAVLLIILGVMNSILEQGILKSYWILGSPILVTVWTGFVILVYFFTRKNIYKLTEK